MDSPLISVLIVSYNTSALTLGCLGSIFTQTRDVLFEVVVVDNGSTDGSANAIAREFPSVKLVCSQTNLGFAAANNLAAERGRGTYFLLLNPDTVILDGAIQKLLAFAKEDGGNNVYGGRTLFPDGKLNPTSCWGPPTLWGSAFRAAGLSSLFAGSPWFDPESLGRWQRDTVREVGIVTGCLLLISGDLWRRLGGFDTRFFMYGEDADLCLRAKSTGSRCLICPDATIVHYGGRSERLRADKVVKLFVAKAQIYCKHWSPIKAALGVALLGGWALSRVVALWVFRNQKSDRAESYRNWLTIWHRRGEWYRAVDL